MLKGIAITLLAFFTATIGVLLSKYFDRALAGYWLGVTSILMLDKITNS